MSAGHIRQRSPGSWEIRYTLGADPATGKRKVATATVKGGKKDAEKELRRLLRAVDTGEHVDPTRMTVGQWLTTWLNTVKQEVAPRSHERYASILEHHLMPALGNLPIAKLAPAHIQSFYNDLAAGGRADKSRARSRRAAADRFTACSVPPLAEPSSSRLSLATRLTCSSAACPRSSERK
jgi:hypothetical protein